VVKGIVEVLSSYMEEVTDSQIGEDQESDIGLVIDGEVCSHVSSDLRSWFYVYVLLTWKFTLVCGLNAIVDYQL